MTQETIQMVELPAKARARQSNQIDAVNDDNDDDDDADRGTQVYDESCHEFRLMLVYEATREGDEEMLRSLLSKEFDRIRILQSDFSCVDCKHPLLIATEQNNAAVAELLLTSGAPVDVQNQDDGNTPLHLAVEWDSEPLVQLLLDHGADWSNVNDDGETALHVAAFHGAVCCARLLLAAGADANWKCDSSSCCSPLHIAAREGRAEMVSLLLSHGAPIDAQDNDGCTPLHLAAFYDESAGRFGFESRAPLDSQLAIVELLLKHGADMELQNKLGLTVLEQAREEEFEVIVRALETHQTRR